MTDYLCQSVFICGSTASFRLERGARRAGCVG
jgi:hypothetical protein